MFKTILRILECVCSEETVRRRLERDTDHGTHPAGNRDFQLYLDVKNRFEAITFPKTVIDTDHDVELCVREALKALEVVTVHGLDSSSGERTSRPHEGDL